VTAWGNNSYGQRNVPVGLTNVVWLAAGLYDSLALRGDGTVVAWGHNGQGQINVPSNLTTVVSIAGGGWHNLALGSDESLIGWGYNSYGQTVAPAALSNIVTIAAGGTHSLAITTASNAPPIALDQIASGYVNHDLLVTLQGNDPDGDALTFKIVSPPRNSWGKATKRPC